MTQPRSGDSHGRKPVENGFFVGLNSVAAPRLDH
jgi:hypothetical protein